jgi:hypothetical protein
MVMWMVAVIDGFNLVRATLMVKIWVWPDLGYESEGNWSFEIQHSDL